MYTDLVIDNLHKVLSGTEFNSIFAKYSFVKVLGDNHEYVEGLNEYKGDFNPTYENFPCGLTFVLDGYFYKLRDNTLDYSVELFDTVSSIKKGDFDNFNKGKKNGSIPLTGSSKAKFIYSVTIPDSAKVFIESKRFKTTSFILSSCRYFDDQGKTVSYEHPCFNKYKLKKHILNNPWNIEYINDIELQELAIKINPFTVNIIKNPTFELYDKAYKLDKRIIRHCSDPEIIKKLNYF